MYKKSSISEISPINARLLIFDAAQVKQSKQIEKETKQRNRSCTNNRKTQKRKKVVGCFPQLAWNWRASAKFASQCITGSPPLGPKNQLGCQHQILKTFSGTRSNWNSEASELIQPDRIDDSKPRCVADGYVEPQFAWRVQSGLPGGLSPTSEQYIALPSLAAQAMFCARKKVVIEHPWSKFHQFHVGGFDAVNELWLNISGYTPTKFYELYAIVSTSPHQPWLTIINISMMGSGWSIHCSVQNPVSSQ